jgi:hypothetical protein
LRINRARDILINNLPKRTINEIEFPLVDSREFDMVDRKILGSIQAEQLPG